jgi:hypothetical protein
VTRRPAPTTVWIVDDDLGFVWWLGEIFTEAGCRALPALSCEQAISLNESLDVGIDLLVLNPGLSGVAGMLQILRSAYPNFKIVLIGNASPALTTTIRPQANLERPSSSQPISRVEWVARVRKLLRDVAAATVV